MSTPSTTLITIKTIENGFTVPVDEKGAPIEGVFVQATGGNDASPGAWGYVKIWNDYEGWHDHFVHSAWDGRSLTRPLRLRIAHDAASATESKCCVYCAADPIGLFLHPKVDRWKNGEVFGEIVERVRELKEVHTFLNSQDFLNGSNEGMLGEKLVYYLIFPSNHQYIFKTTPGYDFKVPADLPEKPDDEFHEVKSFKGNATIRFSSEQLSVMNKPNYFVWLVKKTKSSIGNWEIFKLSGSDVYQATQALAKGKLGLNPNGCNMPVYFSVGVKFDLSQVSRPDKTGDNKEQAASNVSDGETVTTCPEQAASVIVVLPPATPNNSDPAVQITIPLQGVKVTEKGTEQTVYPLTAADWYDSIKATVWFPVANVRTEGTK